mgnify:CR=1 FL=1
MKKTDNYRPFEEFTSNTIFLTYFSHFIAEFVPKCKQKERLKVRLTSHSAPDNIAIISVR